jgi:hypothetical protein
MQQQKKWIKQMGMLGTNDKKQIASLFLPPILAVFLATVGLILVKLCWSSANVIILHTSMLVSFSTIYFGARTKNIWLGFCVGWAMGFNFFLMMVIAKFLKGHDMTINFYLFGILMLLQGILGCFGAFIRRTIEISKNKKQSETRF